MVRCDYPDFEQAQGAGRYEAAGEHVFCRPVYCLRWRGWTCLVNTSRYASHVSLPDTTQPRQLHHRELHRRSSTCGHGSFLPPVLDSGPWSAHWRDTRPTRYLIALLKPVTVSPASAAAPSTIARPRNSLISRPGLLCHIGDPSTIDSQELRLILRAGTHFVF